MTLDARALARTIAASPRVEIAGSTGSTNADVRAAIAREGTAAWPEGSLLVTDDQRAGRGRLDRVWRAPAGSGIAVSIVVDAAGMPARARGWMPLAAGAAVARAAAAQLPGHTVRVKWPNDVLADGRKLAGILTELDGEHIIVGIGVNTAMTAAELPVETAVSFAALGAEADADALLVAILEGVREGARALRDERGDAARAGLAGEIEALCESIGRRVRVEGHGGDVREGTAVGLGAGGELLLDTADGIVEITAGDVVHLR